MPGLLRTKHSENTGLSGFGVVLKTKIRKVSVHLPIWGGQNA